MYIDNENFDKWMERLSKKLSEMGNNLKSLINTNEVLDKDEKIVYIHMNIRKSLMDSLLLNKGAKISCKGTKKCV